MWIPIIYQQLKEVIREQKRNIHSGLYFSPFSDKQWVWGTERTQRVLRPSCSSTYSSPFYLDLWYCLWSHMHHGNFISYHWAIENPFWRSILMMIADWICWLQLSRLPKGQRTLLLSPTSKDGFGQRCQRKATGNISVRAFVRCALVYLCYILSPFCILCCSSYCCHALFLSSICQSETDLFRLQHNINSVYLQMNFEKAEYRKYEKIFQDTN